MSALGSTYLANAQTLSFSGFQTLQGGSGKDTFAISTNGNANLRGGSGDDTFNLDNQYGGSIDGEGGTNDKLQGSAVESVVLTSAATAGFVVANLINGFAGIEVLTGTNSANSTLTGRDAASDWNLAAQNTYVSSALSLAFQGFQQLQGGNATDNFNVTVAKSLALRGGAGQDLFTLAATLTGTIDGEADSDTVARTAGAKFVEHYEYERWIRDGAHRWVYQCREPYRRYRHRHVYHAANGSLTGAINGGGAVDSLNYSAIASAINVNLQTGQADRTGGVSNVESFTVNDGAITGLNAGGAWVLNGGTSVTYAALYNLSGFTTLQGGSGTDTFNVQANSNVNLRGGLGNDIFNLNASLTGSISGEGDNDTWPVRRSTQSRSLVLSIVVRRFTHRRL